MNGLKRAYPGQPISMTANMHNATLDAIHTAQGQRTVQRAGVPMATTAGESVLVENGSGADVDQLDVLGISQPVILPSENESEFLSRVAVKGVTLTADHVGKFIILAEPIASGKIGRGWISGVCPAKISVLNEAHTHADIVDGALKSCASGTCQILWKDTGTGTKAAMVRFGDNGLPIGTANYQTLSWDHTEQKWKADWVRSHW